MFVAARWDRAAWIPRLKKSVKSVGSNEFSIRVPIRTRGSVSPGRQFFPAFPYPHGTRENRPKTRFLCRDGNTIMVCFVGRERPSLPSENRTEFFPSFRLSPRHRSVAKFPNIPLQIVSRFPSIRHFSRV